MEHTATDVAMFQIVRMFLLLLRVRINTIIVHAVAIYEIMNVYIHNYTNIISSQ